MANNYGKAKTAQKFEVAASNSNLAVASLMKCAFDRSKIALVWESVSGKHETFSFFDIDRLSNRIANILTDHKIVFGDRVFTLMNRALELGAADKFTTEPVKAFVVLKKNFEPS